MSEEISVNVPQEVAPNVIPFPNRASTYGRELGQEPRKEAGLKADVLGPVSIQIAIDINRELTEEIAQSIIARRSDFEPYAEAAGFAFNIVEEKQRIKAAGLSEDESRQKILDLENAVKGYAILMLAHDLGKDAPLDPYVSKMAELKEIQDKNELKIKRQVSTEAYKEFKKHADAFNPRIQGSMEKMFEIYDLLKKDLNFTEKTGVWSLLVRCYCFVRYNRKKSAEAGISEFENVTTDVQRDSEENQPDTNEPITASLEKSAQELLDSQPPVNPVSELKTAA